MKEVLTTSVTIPFEYTYTIIIPHKNISVVVATLFGLCSFA